MPSALAVPIFPLPDVTLFPRTLLPLHIFEARYRAMVTDALARDRKICMVRLRPGYEATYAGKPDVYPVGGLGEFSSRGGILDFYSSSEAQPVRLEFIGDIVESIRQYDAATQRSLRALDQIAVVPQRELMIDDADQVVPQAGEVAGGRVVLRTGRQV